MAALQNVRSEADPKWERAHTRETGHANFTTQTVPYPEGKPKDPDWLEVSFCRVCSTHQPYKGGGS